MKLFAENDSIKAASAFWLEYILLFFLGLFMIIIGMLFGYQPFPPHAYVIVLLFCLFIGKKAFDINAKSIQALIVGALGGLCFMGGAVSFFLLLYAIRLDFTNVGKFFLDFIPSAVIGSVISGSFSFISFFLFRYMASLKPAR